jgi:hypothetical protein
LFVSLFVWLIDWLIVRSFVPEKIPFKWLSGLYMIHGPCIIQLYTLKVPTSAQMYIRFSSRFLCTCWYLYSI